MAARLQHPAGLGVPKRCCGMASRRMVLAVQSLRKPLSSLLLEGGRRNGICALCSALRAPDGARRRSSSSSRRSRDSSSSSSTPRPLQPSTPSPASNAGARSDALLQEVLALQAEMRKAMAAYHNAEPIMGDAAYDSLKNQLLQKERELRASGAPAAQTALASSPTAAVGAPPVSQLRKVSHPTPMLSLGSVPNKDELLNWVNRLRRAGMDPEAISWVVEPKVDGLAVRALYREGKLVEAATRGDGSVGEDITHNAGTIRGLPGHVPWPHEVEVRGEVYITHADFEEIKCCEPNLSNPRNAASGSLRLLDPAAAANRRMSFLAYQLLDPRNGAASQLLPRSQWDCLCWLRKHGFAVSTDVARLQGFTAAVAAAETWMERRGQLGYDVDGAVLKVDDMVLQQMLGVSGTDPCWAVAWKFPGLEAVTKLLDISLNVGRTGHVVPVAELEAVEVGGVTVRRATLNNVGFVMAMGLRIGDTVVVRRSGDVIPQVMSVLTELRPNSSSPWQPPSSCPICQQPLTVQSGSSHDQLFCRNMSCSGQSLGLLKHFVSSKRVDGMGPNTVEKLVSNGMVATIADLFKLTQEDLATVAGPKQSGKLYKALNDARALPLKKFLAGLGIRDVGERTARDLAAIYPSLRALQAAATSPSGAAAPSLTCLNSSLAAWFSDPANQQLLDELEAAGVACVRGAPPPVRIEAPKVQAVGGRGAAGSRPGAGGAAGGAAGTAATRASAVPAAGAAASNVAGVLHGGGQQAAAESAGEVELWEDAEEWEGADGVMGGAHDDAGPPARQGLSGMSIVITGTLSDMTRKQFEELLEEHGAKLGSSVSRNTDLLVVAGSDSRRTNKIAKAQELGVRHVDEQGWWEEFERRCGRRPVQRTSLGV